MENQQAIPALCSPVVHIQLADVYVCIRGEWGRRLWGEGKLRKKSVASSVLCSSWRCSLWGCDEPFWLLGQVCAVGRSLLSQERTLSAGPQNQRTPSQWVFSLIFLKHPKMVVDSPNGSYISEWLLITPWEKFNVIISRLARLETTYIRVYEWYHEILSNFYAIYEWYHSRVIWILKA